MPCLLCHWKNKHFISFKQLISDVIYGKGVRKFMLTINLQKTITYHSYVYHVSVVNNFPFEVYKRPLWFSILFLYFINDFGFVLQFYAFLKYNVILWVVHLTDLLQQRCEDNTSISWLQKAAKKAVKYKYTSEWSYIHTACCSFSSGDNLLRSIIFGPDL